MVKGPEATMSVAKAATALFDMLDVIDALNGLIATIDEIDQESGNAAEANELYTHVGSWLDSDKTVETINLMRAKAKKLLARCQYVLKDDSLEEAKMRLGM